MGLLRLLGLDQGSGGGVELNWELLGNLGSVGLLANIKLLGDNLLLLLENNLGLFKLLGDHLLESKLLRSNLLRDNLLPLDLKLLLGDLLLELLGGEVLGRLLFKLLRDGVDMLRNNNLLALDVLLNLELLLLRLLDCHWDRLTSEPVLSLGLFRLDGELLGNLGRLEVGILLLGLLLGKNLGEGEGLVLDLDGLSGWPLLDLNLVLLVAKILSVLHARPLALLGCVECLDLNLVLLFGFLRALLARTLALGRAECLGLDLGRDAGRDLATVPVLSVRNASGKRDGDHGLDVGPLRLLFLVLLLQDRGLLFDGLVHLDLPEVVLVLDLTLDVDGVVRDLRPGGHGHCEEEKRQDLHG